MAKKANRSTFSAIAIAGALLALNACSGGQKTYVHTQHQDWQLQFISDDHVKYLGNRGDHEWAYTAVRDSAGRILSFEMSHPNVGSMDFRLNETTGCFSNHREGVFCPQ